jgi:prepilin-type N-terminal cleavage/methylation domain-containing protein
MPTPGRNVRRGFTLIEVLATLVLLGIVLPVAMRGLSVALAAAGTARHTSEAAVLAEAKLNELAAAAATGGAASGSGDFGDEAHGYRWTATTAAADLNLTELSVTVSWLERGAERSLVVTTLVGDPAAATGGVQ